MSSLSNFAGGRVPLWVSGNTYVVNDVARSPGNYQRYVRIVDGAGTTDPISDGTNWRPDGAPPIKSIQRLVMSMSSSSKTATITEVDPAKTTLHYLGASSSESGGNFGFAMPRFTITNSTTITANTGSGSSGVMLSIEIRTTY